MTNLTYQSKITQIHLQKKAIVYLRQSTEKQVKRNKESQNLQYALIERAKELGFTEVEVIDSDLGSSASIGAKRREGFNRLLSSVAVGEVGIILSREVSRLSRTDKDWCRLLEVCQVFSTLIGDAEGIYDIACMDDQLILGIKGTMSVVELNMLKMRMQAGMEEKARRGELIRTLPVGYVRDNAGRVVKDPDKRIQESIELLFKKFRETRSIRQTFLWFRNEGIEFPVNKKGGNTVKIVWQLPKKSFFEYLLKNPFYAGVYFWGMRPVEKVVVDGKVRKRQGKTRDPEQCKVFIKDHHEGYIDWETYEENKKIIKNNTIGQGGEERTGAVKRGKGLLIGLLRCGHCGRKLMVRYWGRSGSDGQYYCEGDSQNGGKNCIRFGGGGVDRRFSEDLIKVISPLGIQASLEAIRRLKEENDEKRNALIKQLQQLEYEAVRAFEQYNEVDPRNRLVAAELEQRWNEKLGEVEKLKKRLKAQEEGFRSPTQEEQEEILKLGEQFKFVWESEDCSYSLKKKIIRSVVEDIIVEYNDQTDMLTFTIHWKGGCHTQFEMPKPKSRAVTHKTALEDIEIIKKMAVRYGDDKIALVLNRLGRKTGAGNRWNEFRVKWVRKSYSISGHKKTIKDPEILTLQGAAKYCNVSRQTIMRLVEEGVLENNQIVPYAPWEIKRSDLDAEPVRNIVERLKSTGKLDFGWDDLKGQMGLFENS